MSVSIRCSSASTAEPLVKPQEPRLLAAFLFAARQRVQRNTPAISRKLASECMFLFAARQRVQRNSR